MSNFIKKIIITVLALTNLCSLALANDVPEFGVYFGFKGHEFSSDAAGDPSFNEEPGFILGVLSVGELMGAFKLRAGAYYTQRDTKIESGGVKANFDLRYIDVPATVFLPFNDYLSGYIGPVLSIKVSDSCRGDSSICNADAFKDISTFLVSGQAGLMVRFDPNWAGEINYEVGFTDVADDLSVSALNIGVIFSM